MRTTRAATDPGHLVLFGGGAQVERSCLQSDSTEVQSRDRFSHPAARPPGCRALRCCSRLAPQHVSSAQAATLNLGNADRRRSRVDLRKGNDLGRARQGLHRKDRRAEQVRSGLNAVTQLIPTLCCKPNRRRQPQKQKQKPRGSGRGLPILRRNIDATSRIYNLGRPTGRCANLSRRAKTRIP